MAYIVSPPDFSTKASLSAADLDEWWSRVVEQIGGTSWATGTSSVLPGNIDNTNIANGAGFTNAHKREPWSLLSRAVAMESYAGGSVKKIPGGLITHPLRSVDFAFNFGARTGTNSFSGKVALLAGDPRAMTEIASIDTRDQNGVNTWYYVGGDAFWRGNTQPAQMASLLRDLKPGDELAVDLSGLVGVDGSNIMQDITCHIWAKALHVS